MLELGNIIIHATGHDGFLIEWNNLNIYIDPFKLSELPSEQQQYLQAHKAHYIVTTHPHFDHLSKEDIEFVETENTVILSPECCKSLQTKNHWQILNVGETFTQNEITFEGVHAYNVDKKFHTKEMKFIGVVVTVGGKRIYHAGDTDVIEEMKELRNIDVALLPVSGTYTMTAEEAVVCAKEYVKSEIYVPMHWDRIVGDVEMAKHFCENVKGAVLPSF